MCSLILCVLWTLSLDTDLILLKLSKLLNDAIKPVLWWKGHIAQNLSVKAPKINCQQELYRKMDLFGDAGGKTAMDKYQSARP